MFKRKLFTAFVCFAAAIGIGMPVAQAATATVSVPSSIPSDCSVDVTDQLQSVIDSTPDNYKIQFPWAGCYEVEGTLQVTDRTGLYFALNTSTLKQLVTPAETPKVHHDMIDILGGSGVTIHNGTFQSTNPSSSFNVNREWYALVHIEGATDTTVDYVTGLNAWGDFVDIAPDLRNGHIAPDTVLIDHDNTKIIGRNHVSITDGSNITVSNSTFKGNGYQVFDLEMNSNTWHSRNDSIINNVISGPIHGAVLDNGGYGHDIDNLTFSGNVMTVAPKACNSPINVLNTAPTRTNFHINNNTLRTLTTPFAIDGVDGLEVTGNSVVEWGSGCGTVPALNGTDTNVTVTNNDFTGASKLFQKGASYTGVVCGNKLTGSTDQPAAC